MPRSSLGTRTVIIVSGAKVSKTNFLLYQCAILSQVFCYAESTDSSASVNLIKGISIRAGSIGIELDCAVLLGNRGDAISGGDDISGSDAITRGNVRAIADNS